MTPGWGGPVWGEPSPAMGAPVPVRAIAGAAAANYRADGGQSADLSCWPASVAGTAHRLGGGRCEDAYAWVKPRPGRLGLIIADGVSTAGRGGEGADLAVAAAARYLSGPRTGAWPSAGKRWSVPVTTCGRPPDASARLRRQNSPRRSWSPWSPPDGGGRCLARVGDNTGFVTGRRSLA